jgi:trans-AT polyketide synthase, acyltransferase and oxidoreductase domains
MIIRMETIFFMKAFVFPGQGSQVKGMGGSLFDQYKELTITADKILGYSIKDLCMADPNAQLGLTQFTQPALYVVNALSYLKKLTETNKPDFVAGHSLGEYCALFASGVIDFETGLQLVKKRGELMAKAKDGGMAAVIGMSEDAVKTLIASKGLHTIDIANLNSPSQVVISGPKNDIVNAQAIFEKAGCKMYMLLKVSGAFHSRLMADAREEFAVFLTRFSFSPITIPVIANVLARPYPEANIKSLLADQMTHSVKWTESIRYLLGKGVNEFLEVGPGNVLTGLIGRIKNEAGPLVVTDDEPLRTSSVPIVRIEPVVTIKPSFVFMYSGQGSQYFNMGKELYSRNSVFRNAMNHCSELLKPQLGKYLIDIIYDDSKKGQAFDELLYSHPAVFCIGYCLTLVLKDLGISPDAVLGYSLGEYVAAVTAKVITLEQGLKIVVEQAKLLIKKCNNGGMLVVLNNIDTFNSDGQLYQGCTLAAVNYDKCFIVSAEMSKLREVQKQLQAKSIATQLLPVPVPFHSEMIDTIKNDFAVVASGITMQSPQIPMYSCARATQVTGVDSQGLWLAVRDRIRFSDLITQIAKNGNHVFIDVGPTGTLANFVKYGFAGKIVSFTTLNQFGQDVKNIDKLLIDVKQCIEKKE